MEFYCIYIKKPTTIRGRIIDVWSDGYLVAANLAVEAIDKLKNLGIEIPEDEKRIQVKREIIGNNDFYPQTKEEMNEYIADEIHSICMDCFLRHDEVEPDFKWLRDIIW